MIYDYTVIGAGASGLFYAAADNSRGNKLILEKTSRPGQKLLLSGKGMCNITHGGSIKDFVSHYGDKGRLIRSCLYKHSNLELMNFLENAGVPLAEREDGKIFPVSLKARNILDALLAKAADWTLQCNAEVTGIDLSGSISGSEGSTAVDSGIIKLKLGSGRTIETRRLIIASGGASYPATGSDGTFMEIIKRDLGVKTTELKPALTPVYVQNYPFGKLSGVSFSNVTVSCGDHSVTGPLLLTHRCFSGPAVLHLSQHVKTGDTLHINFLPESSPADVYRRLKADHPGNNQGISRYLSSAFHLPKSFSDMMFTDPSRKFSTVGHKELENVCHLMTDRKFSVSGTGGWNEAMVTSGGVSMDEINTKDMRLKKHPAVQVIGEALDINGDTGGYNLQFAWSSAMAALYFNSDCTVSL